MSLLKATDHYCSRCGAHRKVHFTEARDRTERCLRCGGTLVTKHELAPELRKTIRQGAVTQP